MKCLIIFSTGVQVLWGHEDDGHILSEVVKNGFVEKPHSALHGKVVAWQVQRTARKPKVLQGEPRDSWGQIQHGLVGFCFSFNGKWKYFEQMNGLIYLERPL